ncbi:hypothetical protein P691DRAFT_784664 [Macrolepiota fuliginosa MF-IS2]|uniref:Uncharacterized protein n=1 Tax=Macrolepiota fuliginosa MF-IS2 TaxID=1400762 RepID=A0A9P6BZ49_9AGAR|nr:hypothetical protein P691DRAFT_784664 [Macrolepiota fuliginosa MF-IS2]
MSILDNHCRSDNSPDRLNFDVLDLETRSLFQFSLILNLWTYTLARAILPPGKLPFMHVLDNFATVAYLIFVAGGRYFVVFNRPNQQAQQPSPAPQVKLFEPTLKGVLPASFHYGLYIIPRSASFFVIVGFEKVGMYWLSQPCHVKIRLLHIDLSNPTAPMTEVCSLDIPGELKTSVLPIPPLSAQYALGALSVEQRIQDGPSEDGEGYKYYALRVDLSNIIQKGLAEPSQSRITSNRTHLTPAVDERGEEAIFRNFNPFSGQVIVSVNPGSSVLVLDYLNADQV